MTEQSTTEILSDALEEVEDGDKAGNVQRRGDHTFWASRAFMRLHAAITSGSPLPTQWPQAKELEELREKVAKYEAALRDIVEYRATNSTQTKLGHVLYPDSDDFENLEAIAREALKP